MLVQNTRAFQGDESRCPSAIHLLLSIWLLLPPIHLVLRLLPWPVLPRRPSVALPPLSRSPFPEVDAEPIPVSRFTIHLHPKFTEVLADIADYSPRLFVVPAANIALR